MRPPVSRFSPSTPTQSANRGDEGPNGETYGWHQRPPFRHQRPRTPSPLWWTAPARCPNRRPNTRKRGRARYRPPPRRPPHLGHHRRRSRSTGHTPSRFRPQRWRFSHLVSEPRTVTELKDRDGIDVLHHGHRYSILPPSLHPETGQPYTWVHDPTTPMADLPEWLAERTHTGTRRPGGH